MNLIRDIWRFSSIARFEPQSAGDLGRFDITLLPGLINFTSLSNNLDGAFIAEYENRLVIAFRGTRDNIKSWISNIDAYPLQADIDSGKTIHDGFYSGWCEFKKLTTDYIKLLIKYNALKPIFVCGHSRGGALAILCARHIAKNLKIPCSCIPSGNPAVGIKKFRDEFDLLPINCTRVTNGYDIVPTLPPAALGFRHVGKHLHFPKPIWHKWFRKIYDHRYEGYEAEINKLN